MILQSADMDAETNGLQLDALKALLMSIVKADNLYWSKKEHSREDDSEYQTRQKRLNEIRWKIINLRPGTIQ